MNRLFFSAYQWALFPLLLLLFRLFAPFQSKIRKGLAMRSLDHQGLPPWLKYPQKTKPVWFHCASGEFEYAKPVIRQLKQAAPQLPVLVTFFSPSYADSVSRFEGVDFACPVPWDRADDIEKFIEHHQPRCLAIARTDAWPMMLAKTREHGIPSLLFSATLSPGSARTRGLGQWITRAVYRNLSDLFCVTEEDHKAFAKIGLGLQPQVAGDTRYDQVLARLETPRPIRDELFSSKSEDPRPILVAGSTWPEDEKILLKVAQKVSQVIRLIIVPHEPSTSHLLSLEKEIKRHELTSTRYQSATSWRKEDILIVDRVGILAEIYLKGQFAFVGGSFRKTVHSVMEPLAAGCLTFVGPFHANNREALEFRNIQVGEADLTCVEAVSNEDDFVRRLELARMKFSDQRRRDLITQVRSRSGGSEQVVRWILSHDNQLK